MQKHSIVAVQWMTHRLSHTPCGFLIHSVLWAYMHTHLKWVIITSVILMCFFFNPKQASKQVTFCSSSSSWFILNWCHPNKNHVGGFCSKICYRRQRICRKTDDTEIDRNKHIRSFAGLLIMPSRWTEVYEFVSLLPWGSQSAQPGSTIRQLRWCSAAAHRWCIQF